jgi:F-type H+-transporting ATPase subunit O
LPVQPPIALFGVAGRYATALYTAAAKKNDLLAVESDLKQFGQVLENSPALKAFSVDPGVPRNQKAKMFVDSLTAMNACATTKNAFSVLCEGGRMKELPKVMGMYGELMAAAKGEVTAVVNSAQEMDDAAKEQVDKILKSVLGPTTKVNIEAKCNPGLIRGFTVEVGDKFLDYSLATQLKKLVILLGV